MLLWGSGLPQFLGITAKSFSKCRRKYLFFILHLPYCQYHAANVMLKSFLCVGNDVTCRSRPLVRAILRFWTSQASISTNTAINSSLRRSQLEVSRSRRRPSGRPVDDERSSRGRPYTGERIRRPNHQQGQDVQDIEQHTRINERFRALKQARTTRKAPQKGLKAFAQESVSKGLSTGETLREARYDYTRRAGGNRAARRAAQFGHEIDPPSETVHSIASNRRAAHRQSLRRNKELNPPDRGPRGSTAMQDEIGEGNRELSLPEDLRDEHSPRSPGRSFTMGRQAPDDMGFASSRGSVSYGREFPQNNDQTARYRESEALLSMPYTTPASEFLYGTSVVVAALLSARRKLYKLYIYDGDNREVRDQDIRIRKLAVERNVVVESVRGNWLRVMDKMSAGRPHNVRIQILSRSVKPAASNLQYQGVHPRGVSLAEITCHWP